MIKNLGKVLLVVVIQFGVFIGVSTILSFSSQLCLQLGLNKLGLYIILTNAAFGLIMSLLAPIFLMRFNQKNIMIVTAFGMT